MSFLFKSSKKGGPSSSALPPATRDIRSADGPQSQIPTFNGRGTTSPTPGGQSLNGSLNSLAGADKIPVKSPPPGEARETPSRDGVRGSGPPTPEQKVRTRSQDDVSRAFHFGAMAAVARLRL